jgi:osmoprotectant transport system ATP-binding protein
VQSGTPLQILSAPANDFVVDFFGRSDVGIKLLGLQCVADHTRAGDMGEMGAEATGEPVLASLSLREALSIFVSRRVDRLAVVDNEGQRIGVIDLHDLVGKPV